MEAQFVNRYEPSRKMFEEFYKQTSQKYSRIIGVIGLVLVLASGGALFAMGGLTWWLLVALIIGLLLCAALIFLHKVLAYSAMQHTLKTHGGKVHKTIVTFGSKITLQEGLASLSLRYEDIVKTVDCDTIYALMFGQANGVMVKKDGFVTGDYKSFKTFIEKKVEEAKKNT